MSSKSTNAFSGAIKGLFASILKLIGFVISWTFRGTGWLLSKFGELIQRLILKHS